MKKISERLHDLCDRCDGRRRILQEIHEIQWLYWYYCPGEGTYPLFLLGMLVFMMVALYAAQNDIGNVKPFRAFMLTYNIGVPLTVAMMMVRGVCQVLRMQLSAAASASISRISGIGHILTGVGIFMLLVSMKKLAKN